MNNTLTLLKYLESVEYKITDGFEYGWSCFGPNAWQYSTENTDDDDNFYVFNIVFDTKTCIVYMAEFIYYAEPLHTQNCLVWFNPATKNSYDTEYKKRQQELQFDEWPFDDYSERLAELFSIVNKFT